MSAKVFEKGIVAARSRAGNPFFLLQNGGEGKEKGFSEAASLHALRHAALRRPSDRATHRETDSACPPAPAIEMPKHAGAPLIVGEGLLGNWNNAPNGKYKIQMSVRQANMFEAMAGLANDIEVPPTDSIDQSTIAYCEGAKGKPKSKGVWPQLIKNSKFVAHEVGHLLGLDHNLDPNNLMYWTGPVIGDGFITDAQIGIIIKQNNAVIR